MSWINTLLNKLGIGKNYINNVAISAEKAAMMLQMINQTREEELSCDEVHNLLAQYTEMVIRGEDIASLLPLVYLHLDICPDCLEEYDALMQIFDPQEKAKT